jgi:hypothetical protein
MKPARLKSPNSAADTKAMVTYLSLFTSLDDAQAFQSAALKTETKHLPPCARLVRDGGVPTAIYWRWLAAQAEAWS